MHSQAARASRGASPVAPGQAGRGGLAPPAARRRRHWFRREDGQAVVEFALVVPLICVLIVVFVDFARFMNYWFDLNRVASEGARIAAVNTPGLTPAVIKDRFLFDQKASSCVAISYPSAAVGQPVTVDVKVPYTWFSIPASIPFVGGYGGGTLTIRASATMRQEQKATYAQAACP
jgi:hypothetical protein